MNQNNFCCRFINFLIDQGFSDFVFSLGARNSPLVLMLLEREKIDKIRKIHVYSHFDERGSSFFALGLAKTKDPNLREKRPPVLLSTSGTAVGNLLPGLIEANYSGQSLLVITADRPEELHDIGSNQTIRQNILTSQLAFEMELDPWLLVTRNLVNRSYEEAYEVIWSRINYALSWLNKGSVQINTFLREPFDEVYDETHHDLLGKKFPSRFWSRKNYPLQITNGDLNDLMVVVDRTNEANKKGILLLGEISQMIDRSLVIELADQLFKRGWLIVVDVLCGMAIPQRWYNQCWIYSSRFSLLDNFFEDNEFLEQVETILHLGGRVVSKGWEQWIKKKSIPNYFLVNDIGYRLDPAERVTVHYPLKVENFINSLLRRLRSEKLKEICTYEWKILKEKNREFMRFHQDYKFDVLCELSLMSTLNRFLQQQLNDLKKIGLFLGNSRPIRDFAERCHLEVFPTDPFDKFANRLMIFSNRGASGIDGQLSTALGIRARLSYLHSCDWFFSVLGDLTLLHDLNALAWSFMLKKDIQSKLGMTLLVVNNQEGTIFNFLSLPRPINDFSNFNDEVKTNILDEDKKEEEKLRSKFLYRHPFSFKGVAEMFSWRYLLAETQEQLEEALAILNPDDYCLLEVKIDSTKNLQQHRLYQDRCDFFLKS